MVADDSKKAPESGPKKGTSGFEESSKSAPPQEPTSGPATEQEKQEEAVLSIPHGGVISEIVEEYPGHIVSNVWKILVQWQRVNRFSRFPIEAPPERLVADLAETYVKTIELTMSARYKRINLHRLITFLSLLSLIPAVIFIINHIVSDDLYMMQHVAHLSLWPTFMFPLTVHLLLFPLVTCALVFGTRRFRLFRVCAYLNAAVLVSIYVATTLLLLFPAFPPLTEEINRIIENAIDGMMQAAVHLEDTNTETMRDMVAGSYMQVAVWCVVQSVVCSCCFIINMNTLTAMRYYNKKRVEADLPSSRRAARSDNTALLGQATRRVRISNYRTIVEVSRGNARSPTAVNS